MPMPVRLLQSKFPSKPAAELKKFSLNLVYVHPFTSALVNLVMRHQS